MRAFAPKVHHQAVKNYVIQLSKYNDIYVRTLLQPMRFIKKIIRITHSINNKIARGFKKRRRKKEETSCF